MFKVVDDKNQGEVELTEWLESLREAAPCVHLETLKQRILARYRSFDAAFDSLDDDKNGRINGDEWRDHCANWRIVAADAKVLFEMLLDTRGDDGEKIWSQGGITRMMFVSAMSRAEAWTVLWNVARSLIRKNPNSSFDKIFKNVKMNKHRNLSYGEFQSLISSFGIVLSDQHASALLNIVKPTLDALVVALKMHAGALLERAPAGKTASLAKRRHSILTRRKSFMLKDPSDPDALDAISVEKTDDMSSDFPSSPDAAASSIASPSSATLPGSPRRKKSLLENMRTAPSFVALEEEQEESVVSVVTKALSKYVDVQVQDVSWLDLHVGIKLVQMLSPRLLAKYRTIPMAFKALSTASQGRKKDAVESDTMWRVDFVSATTKYLGYGPGDAIRMFSVLDLVGNGFLTLPEFMMALHHVSPLEKLSDVGKKLTTVCKKAEDVEEAIVMIGANHDQEVYVDEFEQALVRIWIPDTEAQMIFRVLDVYERGSVYWSELQAVLEEEDQYLAIHEIVKLLVKTYKSADAIYSVIDKEFPPYPDEEGAEEVEEGGINRVLDAILTKWRVPLALRPHIQFFWKPKSEEERKTFSAPTREILLLRIKMYAQEFFGKELAASRAHEKIVKLKGKAKAQMRKVAAAVAAFKQEEGGADGVDVHFLFFIIYLSPSDTFLNDFT